MLVESRIGRCRFVFTAQKAVVALGIQGHIGRQTVERRKLVLPMLIWFWELACMSWIQRPTSVERGQHGLGPTGDFSRLVAARFGSIFLNAPWSFSQKATWNATI